MEAPANCGRPFVPTSYGRVHQAVRKRMMTVWLQGKNGRGTPQRASEDFSDRDLPKNSLSIRLWIRRPIQGAFIEQT